MDMTKRRFGKRCGLLMTMIAVCPAPMAMSAAASPAAAAEDVQPAPKPAKLINSGDVLSGELNAMKIRAGKKGKRVATYQVTSEPRRLPSANGLCGLETGPETFQIVTNNDAQVAQLRNFIGKEVSLKVDEVACSQEAGQMSDAVVTKWSVVTKR
jgi:hypothetical protein